MSRHGIINYGNLDRMNKVVEKATEGKPITIGFIGGSITMGCFSSSHTTCYPYLVYEWWKEKFPMAQVNYVNAGIGATTSQFAVARVQEDLLSEKPDFVVIEFSVNDNKSDLFMETYEGLTRKILKCETEPAVLILNNVEYDTGNNAQDIHNKIGEYYDLPIVSMKDSIYEEMLDGAFTKEEVTPDNLHPSDLGHKLIADKVKNLLEELFLRGKDSDPVAYELPKASYTANRYEDSVILHNNHIEPVLKGFHLDDSKKESMTDIFKLGWKAREVGASIFFHVNCQIILIQYKKTINRIAPKAIAIVDGDEERAILLDANFEETWGDCLYMQDLYLGEKKEAHTLEIRITEVDKPSDIDFYLVSVITA